MRCPASKFLTHTLSHVCFLVLLAAGTFRFDERTFPISSTPDALDRVVDSDLHREKVAVFLKATFRPANVLITNVQICLMFWILGKLICFFCIRFFVSLLSLSLSGSISLVN